MSRSPLLWRFAAGLAWIAAGCGFATGGKLLVGAAWEPLASHTMLGGWVAELPCGFFAALFVVATTGAVGLLLWLLDEDRARAPRALPVYVGTVVATWVGPGGFVPGVACSLLAAALGGVEVHARRARRWWPAVACMAAFCFAELFAYAGLRFAAGC